MRCALPLAHEAAICTACEKQPPHYQQLHALFDYRWPVKGFMTQFKYHGQLYFANMLGYLMAQHLTMTKHYDCIVPIPLHPRRQRARGFNQTLELAKAIAREIDVPLDRWSCTRVQHHAPQTTLSAKTRRRNIHASSFAISKRFKAKSVLVIEDVVTTGSTINAFSKALSQKGVKNIDIWACCRTPI